MLDTPQYLGCTLTASILGKEERCPPHEKAETLDSLILGSLTQWLADHDDTLIIEWERCPIWRSLTPYPSTPRPLLHALCGPLTCEACAAVRGFLGMASRHLRSSSGPLGEAVERTTRCST